LQSFHAPTQPLHAPFLLVTNIMSILATTEFALPISVSNPLDDTADGDSTMRAIHLEGTQPTVGQECCLVQIYPADVVSGMLLLETNRLVVGRDPAVDLPLVDSSVSRQHAAFVSESTGYRIQDLGSTNGTLVNGARVSDRSLRSGDTIQIGSFIFKFLSAGSIESKYHETVYSAMTRDALTGAMNKRYLLETLSREVARAIRQQQSLSLLMLDIDHFKSVNDTHGHLVGDEVLREFGRRILADCREEDLLARYGGEEFCLVLCSSGRNEAVEIANRYREVIAGNPFQTTTGLLPVTASFGVSCLDPAAPMNADELIRQADDNLYEAKRSGRNRVVG
jgi:diguanylate cyclase (GGDEF)-like protein